MAWVAGVAVVAAICRVRLGFVVLPWLACGWAVWEGTRPPPAEPALVSAPVRFLRDLLQAALPFLMFGFLVLSTFLILVLLLAAGWGGPSRS
jgi:hypothetical protein